MPGSRRKVWFVTSTWPSSQRPGTGAFVRNLFDALAADPALSMRLWAPTPDSSSPTLRRLAIGKPLAAYAAQGVTGLPVIAAFLTRLAWDSVAARRWADVFHVNWTPPVMATWPARRPTVVTVRGSDLVLLQGNPKLRTLCARCLGQSVLVAVAPWQADPLRELFPGVPVEVNPNGIDEHWFDCPPPPDSADELPLFLYVGRITPDKLGALPSWATQLEREGLARFRFVGPRDRATPISERGEHAPPVAQRDLINHLEAARALVSLSTHEGRPGSVLEAMAAGRAVVLSDIPAHRELVDGGNNGYLARDLDEFRAAVVGLLQPSHANALGQSARAWARKNLTTWRDCARRYAGIYEDCVTRYGS